MTEQDECEKESLLYLDDLQVGQTFVTGSHLMREEDIKAFAAQFDPQPFHLDAEKAKTTLFRGLAASGWHTAAVTMRLQVESGPRLAGGMIGSSGHLTWPRPTRPGDVLQVKMEVTEIAATKPERGLVTFRTETKNQAGEVVQIALFNLVVMRRSTGTG